MISDLLTISFLTKENTGPKKPQNLNQMHIKTIKFKKFPKKEKLKNRNIKQRTFCYHIEAIKGF